MQNLHTMHRFFGPSVPKFTHSIPKFPVSWTPLCLSFEVHDVEEAPPLAPEFRRQMIELVRAGRTPERLAKEFEPSAQAIRNWVRRPTVMRTAARMA